LCTCPETYTEQSAIVARQGHIRHRKQPNLPRVSLCTCPETYTEQSTIVARQDNIRHRKQPNLPRVSLCTCPEPCTQQTAIVARQGYIRKHRWRAGRRALERDSQENIRVAHRVSFVDMAKTQYVCMGQTISYCILSYSKSAAPRARVFPSAGSRGTERGHSLPLKLMLSPLSSAS